VTTYERLTLMRELVRRTRLGLVTNDDVSETRAYLQVYDRDLKHLCTLYVSANASTLAVYDTQLDDARFPFVEPDLVSRLRKTLRTLRDRHRRTRTR